MTDRRGGSFLVAFLLSGLLGGCEAAVLEPVSKMEASRRKGLAADGSDLCAWFGWYGDGWCDAFCPKPDPDCSPSASCDPYQPRFPSPQVLVAPTGFEDRLLALLGAAGSSVHVMMYQLDRQPFVDALLALQARGVEVRVMLDRNQGGNLPARQQLGAAGIAVRDAPAGFSYNHSKVLLVDGWQAIILSGNLNQSSLGERNYAVVDEDPADVAVAESIFAADWAGSAMPDLSCTRLAVSPTNSKDRLLGHIGRAQRSLDLEEMFLTDRDVMAAVKARAAAGVAVRVLLSDPSWQAASRASADELAAAGVPVRFFAALHLHAKVILSDGVPFVGSENLSLTSLTRNREVGLFLPEPASAAVVARQFEADWALGVVP